MNYKIAILVFLISITVQAQEQDNQLDEIVISENRLQIPFNKTARAIEIVTAIEIQKLPAKNIQEVLSLVAGVDIKQRGPFGTQADVSIDGGSFEQTLILINGVKMNDVQTAHHALNLALPLDAIERIEVLRGPAARMYGINSLTGAINIVTKKVTESVLYSNSYIGSSFKNKEKEDGNGIYWGGGTQIMGTWFKEQHNHLLSYSKDKYNGQRYNTESNVDKFFYQGKFALNNLNTVQIMAGHIDNKFGANGYYAAPGDINSFEIVKTTFGSVGSNHKITEKFTLRPQVSLRYNEDDYRYFKNDLNKARSQHYTNSINIELHSSLETKLGTLGFGLESRWEEIKSSNIGEHQRDNYGFYAEYKTNLLNKIFVNTGTYINYNSDYGWQMFPGIDVAYSISEYWQLGMNIGSSQRIPSFTDLYLNQRPGNIGNPNLKSENAYQYEVLAKYQHPKWTLHGRYFRRNINQFIDWLRVDDIQPYQPENVGTNIMQGFNFHVKKSLNLNDFGRIKLQGSYTYLQPQISNNSYTSKYVLESLKHQVLILASYSYKQFMLQATNRYQKRELNKGYNLNDFRFCYTFSRFDIYLDVTNAFGTQYKEVGTVPMPSNWYSLGIRWKV